LVAVGVHRPHVPMFAPQRFYDMYEEVALPGVMEPPEGAAERTLKNLGSQVGAHLKDSGEKLSKDETDGQGHLPEKIIMNIRRAYYASATTVDFHLGQVMDKLKELKVWDSTAIVVTSDHGWSLGENNQWAKGTLQETACWVPLMMRVPWILDSIGRKMGSPVESVSIYQTLIDVFGLPESTEKLEGKSFANLLRSPSDDEDNDMAAFSQVNGGNKGFSVRTRKYRYSEYWWIEPAQKSDIPGQKFDIVWDNGVERELYAVEAKTAFDGYDANLAYSKADDKEIMAELTKHAKLLHAAFPLWFDNPEGIKASQLVEANNETILTPDGMGAHPNATNATNWLRDEDAEDMLAHLISGMRADLSEDA